MEKSTLVHKNGPRYYSHESNDGQICAIIPPQSHRPVTYRREGKEQWIRNASSMPFALPVLMAGCFLISASPTCWRIACWGWMRAASIVAAGTILFPHKVNQQR